MPELPEVEFARKQLSRWLKNAKIVRAEVVDARILDAKVKGIAIEKSLTGRLVKSVERRGKWLRIVLDKGKIFSHFGMTGKWVLAENDKPVRFEKIRLDIVQGQGKKKFSVSYADPRLFGRFVVAEKDLDAWSSLGPDPLNDGIDADALHLKLMRRSLPIKPTLLDQKVLAGIGNIQATEALFFARIDPRRPSNQLSRKETGAIVKGIEKSLRETLALQKGPKLTYVEEAGAENQFTIYGHGDEPCPNCGTPLKKIALAGRGTVFCPRDQK
ncbi:MAG: bifunctional DNA-formamidopyrimidine glycosylase/DNA-(apurinic or apyrimidinic site) lyase [Polyangiaceae bacterium]